MSVNNVDAALGLAFKTRDYFQLAGERLAVGNAAFETVMQEPGTTIYAPPNAAQRVRIRAGGNAADDSAGTGAQQVTIVGLNATNQITVEALTTAGAAASAFSTNSFLRVNQAFVSRAGSGGVNVGNVQIENETGPATNSAFILAARGLSQCAFYSLMQGASIPTSNPNFFASAGVGAFLQDGIYVSVRTNPINLQLIQFTRNSVNNLYATQVLLNVNSIPVGENFIEIPGALRLERPFPIGDLTDQGLDITIQAQATAATSDVVVRAGGYFQSN